MWASARFITSFISFILFWQWYHLPWIHTRWFIFHALIFHSFNPRLKKNPFTWPNWYYSCYYAETSQPICSVKQFTGFYMIEVLVLNGPTRYNMLLTRFRFQWKFLYKISFLRHYPISCHCSLSIPLQNIWFSDVFRGYRKRPIAWNELKT